MNKQYEKLGQFIRLVDVRNKDLSINHLLGVSITKQFIESIANTIGTDFSNYKVVKQGQFAYGPVTSRNGEKVSVALLKEKECIISSSYSVFEVIYENQLMPEYLMLWFSRPEFDRYARFKSHGSVREIFDWNEMCNVELPVPPIEEQRNIVKAYKTITDRIKLKRKINSNLEQQAQAIFKSWFVDFEPFGRVMPDDWHMGTLSDIADVMSEKRPPMKQSEKTNEICVPLVGATSVIGYTNKYNYNDKILVTGRVGTHGIVQRFYSPCWASDNTLIIKSKYYEYVYQILHIVDYKAMNRGSTQPLITQGDLKKIVVLIPDNAILLKFESTIGILMDTIMSNNNENQRLSALRDSLLSKLINAEIDL